MFNLIQHLKFVSEIEAKEKLRMIDSFVRGRLPEKKVPRRAERRTDIAITYIDGEGKSGQYYAARYAEENRISVRSIMPPSNFSEALKTYSSKIGRISAIVIVDDIVATGDSLSRKFLKFVDQNEAVLREAGVPTVLACLFATPDGEARVHSAINQIDWLDCELRVCEYLTSEQFAFHTNAKIWRTQEEFDRAYSLCKDLGSQIYGKDAFGYGNQGLLIVFPDTCPNNTLPIFHSGSTSDANKIWRPLFPRIEN